MSDNAIVGIVTCVLSFVGGGVGAYIALRVGIASLSEKVSALTEWLQKVAAGDRKLDGEFAATLYEHGRRLDRIEARHCCERKNEEP